MFVTAKQVDGAAGAMWRVADPFGHALELPAIRDQQGRVEIGVVGTRSAPRVHPKTPAMAGALRSLGRPLLLIDVRRNGVGGSGSWSPREFATTVPRLMASAAPYSYLHLPVLAPETELLEQARTLPWQTFRDRYVDGLTPEATKIGRAFVEAMYSIGGLVVMLCAEPDHADFEGCEQHEQDELYCHRFSCARVLASAIHAAHPKHVVELVALDLTAWHDAGDAYTPRRWTLAGRGQA